MEKLFTQQLNVNGTSVSYNVSFHNEAYYFEPATPDAPAFSVSRERDEWMTGDDLSSSLFSAATVALDKYLLSQH